MLRSLVREMELPHSKLSNTYEGLSVLLLVFVFILQPFFFHPHEPIYIGLCYQQLPHFLTGAPVLGIGLFLFLQEPGILGLQLLDLGQLLDPHIVKGIFGRLMEQDFFLMFLSEFL